MVDKKIPICPKCGAESVGFEKYNDVDSGDIKISNEGIFYVYSCYWCGKFTSGHLHSLEEVKNFENTLPIKIKKPRED